MAMNVIEQLIAHNECQNKNTTISHTHGVYQAKRKETVAQKTSTTLLAIRIWCIKREKKREREFINCCDNNEILCQSCGKHAQQSLQVATTRSHYHQQTVVNGIVFNVHNGYTSVKLTADEHQSSSFK